MTRSASDLGIQVRAGIHTGECLVGPSDVSGVAVHLASRVMDEAGPGEVLVSATVKDVVFGSGLGFTDRGDHHLKGVDEERRLYAVSAVG